jgi:hypothetical protein
MLETVLALETAIAVELARRLQLSDEDLTVRIVANTSIGVLRAVGRAYAQPGGRDFDPADVVSARLDELDSLFETLEHLASENSVASRADPQAGGSIRSNPVRARSGSGTTKVPSDS